MDRFDFYAGQIVTQADLDQAFTDCEVSEGHLATDGGMIQVDSGASPGPTALGGILSGLVISASAGVDKATITAGVARDETGRRITLPSGATVSLTKAGATDEGDIVDALPASGASIAASCPIGRQIVASLFIVADEHLSLLEQDETETWVYTRREDSFHFTVEIGTSFDPAAVPDPIVVSALANGKVLLADILLTNNAGTMVAIAGGVCTCDRDWDLLGGNYAKANGRRSDAIAFEGSNADFPQLGSVNYLRAPTVRKALYDMMAMLQDNASGFPGAYNVGAIAETGAGLLHEAIVAKTLTKGNVSVQLLELLNAVNTKLSRGGDTIQPQAGVDGLVLDPSVMTDTQALLSILSLSNAGAAPFLRVSGSRGHLCLPHPLYEDFNWIGPAAGSLTFSGETDEWGTTVIGGGGSIGLQTSVPGGVLIFVTSGGANDGITLASGYNTATGVSHGRWNCGAAPWAIFGIRFRIPAIGSMNDLKLNFGLSTFGGSSSASLLYNDDTAGGTPNKNLYIVCADSIGGSGAAPLGELSQDTWYTARIAVLGDTSVVGQLAEEGAMPGPEVFAPPPGGTMADSHYSAVAGIIGTTGVAARTLEVDWIYAADGYLPPDMR